MQLLLEDATSNGSSDPIDFSPKESNFGKGAVIAFGTWDTATVTFEFSPDGGTTYYAVGSDTTFSANGWSNFEIQGIVKLRATLSSVGLGTSVSFGIM